MGWSKEQLAAIYTYDKNILVAAAAGSGKTSVLVTRIIERILDEAQDFSVDKVLVVTFTKAAAAEMRQRISMALEKELAKNPQSHHLKRQQMLLNSASITTIDSFCQSIVKQNFHRLNLDPKFRIANEGELTLLQYEMIEDLFETKYANLENEPAFRLFIDHYGKKHQDDALYAMLLDIYQFSRSNPNPTAWLEQLKDAFVFTEETAIWQSPWGQALREKVSADLARCKELIEASIRLAEDAMFTAYDKTLAADQAYIDEFIIAFETSWQKIDECIAKNSFGRLANAPKDADEEVKDALKKNRETYKAIITQLCEKFFYADFAAIRQEFLTIQPVAAAIVELVKEFGARFAKAKQEKSIVDFYDLEHFCLDLLQETVDGELVPSAVANALQAKYQEVMIDEYQDTNGLQEAILQLIKRGRQANLFMVGDVKQSIYRFRLAEPELFNQKYQTYPTRGDSYTLIKLSNNYRSREAIIDAVNFIFAQVMTLKATELDYRGAELIAQADYPVCEGKSFAEPVELNFIDCVKSDAGEENEGAQDEDMSTFALESEWIATRIEQLMQEGYQVYDKDRGGYRPLMLRDIVILLRAVKGKSDILLETLRNHNIPAYAELSAGYFAAIEVQIMLALLAIIDNPRQDIELAAVLYSPMVALTTEELSFIRLAEENVDLWDALLTYCKKNHDKLADKLKEFVERLEKWRNASAHKSVPELIWQLFNDTGYYDYVGSMEGGLLRQANLRMLYDRAGEYEATNFRGLFRFLRFIEKMRAKETDLSVARTLSESENVVRVMSIHKSKGLEFPVVFLADLGKQFNMRDKNKTMLLHKKLGLGISITSGGDTALARLRYPGVLRNIIAREMENESKAEELRVLYVAMTRAREKLILVGAVKELAKKAAKWCEAITTKTQELPQDTILSAKTFLDWLAPSLLRHESGEVLRRYSGYEGYVANPMWDAKGEWRIQIIQAGDLLSSEPALTEVNAEFLQKIKEKAELPASIQKEAVEAILNWQYPYQDAIDKPAKLSVTEMKRRFDNIEQDEFGQNMLMGEAKETKTFTRPRFKQELKELTGAEYGTLMHNVMQHLPLDIKSTQSAVRLNLEKMVEKEIILPEQLSMINLYGLTSFLKSDLAKRMKESQKVRRELPFSIMLDAGEIYDTMQSGNEKIFVQGVIDVLFDEGDKLILLDYKTDKADEEERIRNRHAFQLNLYAKAIEKIFKKKVSEKYLYLFSMGKVIRVE
ncbi:helicase-exonuclease AddAB subunit AddA [Anaerosinus sp.]|uniref:helicase-exonuclease AddAB subunit AddA n=1 Tax=Selenobaculum sp. TaxID=3074374 RepID=UPI003AB6125E